MQFILIFIPGPSYVDVETAIAKLKKYKLPASDQILTEQIQAGGKILYTQSAALNDPCLPLSGYGLSNFRFSHLETSKYI
jgi:hypothetical protein